MVKFLYGKFLAMHRKLCGGEIHSPVASPYREVKFLPVEIQQGKIYWAGVENKIPRW